MELKEKKKCASHLHHEANVEQIFSLAGRLSDPNLDPHRLPTLVRIHLNKKTFMHAQQAGHPRAVLSSASTARPASPTTKRMRWSLESDASTAEASTD